MSKKAGGSVVRQNKTVNPQQGQAYSIALGQGQGAIQKNYTNNSSFSKKSKWQGIKDPNLRQKAKQSAMANKPNNMQESVEVNKIVKNLYDFKREKYESQFNSYSRNDLGITKSKRGLIKGIVFKNELGTPVAKVEVCCIENKNLITTFDINPQYQGLGFAKQLLEIAKSSLSANFIEIDMDKESKLTFFESQGFVKIGATKNRYVLKLQITNNTLKPTFVTNFDNPAATAVGEVNVDGLYNCGGYDYEGYRNYI